MTLHFVQLHGGAAVPRQQEQRLARSHVLRGRSGRKPRSSASSALQLKRSAHMQRVSRQIECPACTQTNICHRLHPHPSYKEGVNMGMPIWHDLVLVSMPYQLSRKHRGLIHKCQLHTERYFTHQGCSLWSADMHLAGHQIIRQVLYPPKFCTLTDGIVSTWMQYVFEDDACM